MKSFHEMNSTTYYVFVNNKFDVKSSKSKWVKLETNILD